MTAGRARASRSSRQNWGSCSSTWRVAPIVTPQPAASMPMLSWPTITPRITPALNATPTAAGPAKRPWIWSIAVNTAEKPWRARAGAMMRMSVAVSSARASSRLKIAAGTSGQIAARPANTTSTSPVQTASAETSLHALSVPASARSRWNVGMIRVTSVYSRTAATEFTISSALTKASVVPVVP